MGFVCTALALYVHHQRTDLGIARVALLHASSACQGPAEGDLVGVFQIRSHWQTGCEARHRYTAGADQTREVRVRRFAFHIGVQGEDDLFDCFVFQTGEQLLNAQVCWADASHWVDGSAENMVQTVVFCRVLNSHDVTRVFNNADDAVVTARVLADSARADFGDVSADFTEANFFAQCGDGLGEVLHIVL